MRGKADDTFSDEEQHQVEPDGLLHGTTEEVQVQVEPPCLSFGVKGLYWLNGLTLALPTTALLYVVNSRVSMPLKFLSAYGAVAFLPFSLKPIFAFLSEFFDRNLLLTVLLAMSGISIAGTSMIPTGGIMWCFVLAFLRGATSAWPEFLLGLSLLDEAQSNDHFASAAASFQAQAATSRNIGSLMAYICLFCVFLADKVSDNREGLGDKIVGKILLGTGCFNIAGAIFAKVYSVGSKHTYSRIEGEESVEENHENNNGRNACQDDETKGQSSEGVWSALLVVSLQASVLLFALRQQILHITPYWCWRVALFVCLLVLLISAGCSMQGWTLAKRVGLFLVVKHAMPSPAYLMDTVVYEAFVDSPALLQLNSLFDTGAITLASWTYGKVLARHCQGSEFLLVIVGTTVTFSIATLLNMVIVGLTDSHSNSAGLFIGVCFLSLASTYFSELYFLPSTVLATTSVVSTPDATVVSSSNDGASSRMRYGTLVSCIDFGGQIGSWMTVPLVSAFRIDRANGYANVDWFILVTAIMSMVPLILLPCLQGFVSRRTT